MYIFVNFISLFFNLNEDITAKYLISKPHIEQENMVMMTYYFRSLLPYVFGFWTFYLFINSTAGRLQQLGFSKWYGYLPVIIWVLGGVIGNLHDEFGVLSLNDPDKIDTSYSDNAYLICSYASFFSMAVLALIALFWEEDSNKN